jgi:hypothetical protein
MSEKTNDSKSGFGSDDSWKKRASAEASLNTEVSDTEKQWQPHQPPCCDSPAVNSLHDDQDLPKSSTSADESLQDEVTYPEGGLRAWLVVFGSFCALFAGLGWFSLQ